MLSVNPLMDPTPLEQELMEHLNRMRLDPQGELDALFTSLDPLVARDPDADEAINYFGDPTLEEILSDWASLSPVAPLTWNESLNESAVGHSQLMVQFDQQSHQLPGELGLLDRARAAGYEDDLGVSAGENVFAYANSAFHTHSAFAIDWGVVDRGHRANLMAAQYREVGIGIVTDYDSETDVGPLIVTQDFGSRSSFDQQHLLGVVFDDLNENGWYDSGEGLSDVTIEIVGTDQTYTVTSMSAGGYQVEVTPDVYTLTAQGGGLSSPIVHQDVVVGVDNVKVDFVGSSGPNQPPSVDLNGPGQAGIDYSTSFYRDAGPALIVDPGLTVTDQDEDSLVSATVTIADLRDVGAEYVSVDTSGTGIVAGFDQFTGVLRLTGSEDAADYQQVLSTLSYYNGATVPTGISRSVEVTVNDGFHDSSVAISTVDFTAPNISIDDIMLAEGDYGTTSFAFSVNLSSASSLPVAVSYSFIDGTAGSGSDYSGIGGQVTFQPGQTQQTIDVTVNGDIAAEADELFYVSLFNPQYGVLIDAQAVATIANDDTAQDLGPLASAKIDNLDPSAGRVLLTFRTLNQGLLSLETLFAGPVDSVGMTLYDEFRNEQPLAVSSSFYENQRIDWLTEADTSYYLSISGSGDDVLLHLVNLVDVDDGAVVVRGTAGDDTLEFDVTASRNVTINGVLYEFDEATVESLAFEGGDGYDTAHLASVDPNANDSAEIWPDHGTFTSAGVTATLTDVESININSGDGEDTVVIHDSAGDDELFARAATSAVPVSSITIADYGDDPAFVPTYSHSVANFENLTTDSTAGTDVASFFDSDGDDEFIGRQFETVLSGDGFNFRAENFQYTHGYAKAGGDDTAELYDTSQDDRFKGDSEYARMFHGIFQRRAKFFETVVAYATAGGTDDARLFDSPGNDQLTASPTETRLRSDDAGYDLTVVSFDEVLVRASSGYDTAAFIGGAGDDLLLHKWLRQDTLAKSPKTEMMDNDTKGGVYKVTARKFDRTTATGGQGGYDIAKFWDTLEADRFVADGDTAAMYNPADELLYDAIAFHKAVFNHVNGGGDQTEATVYNFLLSEYWPP